MIVDPIAVLYTMDVHEFGQSDVNLGQPLEESTWGNHTIV